MNELVLVRASTEQTPTFALRNYLGFVSRFIATTERNVSASRRITEAQCALVEKLMREGRDTSDACDMLRAAQATQAMFQAQLDELRQLTLPN